MKYRVQQVNGLWCVVDKDSGYIAEEYECLVEAAKACKWINENN